MVQTKLAARTLNTDVSRVRRGVSDSSRSTEFKGSRLVAHFQILDSEIRGTNGSLIIYRGIAGSTLPARTARYAIFPWGRRRMIA